MFRIQGLANKKTGDFGGRRQSEIARFIVKRELEVEKASTV